MSGLEDSYALGLDLGTTFSCIGVFRNGGVEIIPNRNGEKVTPSIVTILDEDNILKGEEAEDHLVKDYESSIYAIKRFIGRDFRDKNIEKEIKFENFPFNIIKNEKDNFPLVEIVKNGTKLHFKLEEISSYVIKKMVQSAEDYLNRKINKLVITVPANFNDSQRDSTIKAAKLAGIEVLRIINEPTAAALAYGLQEKNNLKNNSKILIFDLGGGTFDVTILNINKDKDGQNFDILATNSNKFLGGEDFDNKLVDHFLDEFCRKMEENKEEIKKDKKAIKRLKIACENIKRVLSIEKETTLCLNNFYNNQDIFEDISRNSFEYLCKDLFEKLKEPVDDALAYAKLTAKDINEIVLVGGSTRIPHIKTILKEKFENIKINDQINPDETVAYGATLVAAKILIKRDNLLLGFNLMDITPLSLGVEVVNDSEDEEIRKEGGKMSVIIKRGQTIPYKNTRSYKTAFDNETSVDIVIYEGEKRYVKDNHILKTITLNGLTSKPKGQVKIDVQFFIDVNGILTVTGTEIDEGKNNSIKVSIKNDMINMTEEEIEKLRKKNEKYYKTRDDEGEMDFYNLKLNLKELQDAYKESKVEEDKYNILINYNNTLEEFIDLFDKDNFDNETMIEKFYIYIKELFFSYGKTLNMENNISKEIEIKNNIINKTKDYIFEFIKKSYGYLNNLVETIKDFPKKIFYEILIFIMEKFNDCGKECLKKMTKFCKYHSLIYFEKSKWFFDNYIQNMNNIAICDQNIRKNCKLQYETCKIYINDIISGAILLCDESLKLGKLIPSGTGFTYMKQNLIFGEKDEEEKNTIVLEHYEKLLADCQVKGNLRNLSKDEQKRVQEEEAICLANIIKISHRFLGKTNYQNLCLLGEKCEFIAANKLKIDSKVEWYKEFKEIYEEIQKLNKVMTSINETKSKIRRIHKKEFDEIEEKFNKKNSKNEFIQYILNTTPYDGYEKDKSNNKLSFKKEKEDELINYLRQKYHPDNYELTDNEKGQLRYCKIETIEALLNKLYNNINL